MMDVAEETLFGMSTLARTCDAVSQMRYTKDQLMLEVVRSSYKFGEPTN
jgi:hypothetical protein